MLLIGVIPFSEGHPPGRAAEVSRRVVQAFDLTRASLAVALEILGTAP